MSMFAGVETAAPIEVFHVVKLFNDDTDARKVNLSVGAYRTDDAKPWVLPVVRDAEAKLAADTTQNHEYLQICGFEPFNQESMKLVFGEDHAVLKEQRALGIQCLSGTGSLRVGAEFLHKALKCSIVYVSKPTWGNHKLIFKEAGFSEVRDYTYWDQANRKINFDGMMADLKSAPEKAVIVLHGCAHNPTGMDPTQDQWKEIQKICKERKLIAFFDIAYIGFASGDPAADAWSVRYFANQPGQELLVAQSYAKNFGLYNERAGALTIVANDTATIPPIKSQITMLIRANWSNPPNHGCKIVHLVLSTPDMKAKWLGHIKEMSGRVKDMRAALRGHLEKLGTPGTWDHVTTQIGMFSFLGISEAQVMHMREKHRIYLLKSGRINVCGLTTKNVEYVAKAIDDAVRNA